LVGILIGLLKIFKKVDHRERVIFTDGIDPESRREDLREQEGKFNCHQ